MNYSSGGSPPDLRTRTRRFALAVIWLVEGLPRTMSAFVLARQLIRSATSVGAHYREATRSRSDAEFVSKLEVGQQELEETIYWLELLGEGGLARAGMIEPLLREANELMAILVTCTVRAKRRRR